MLIEANENGIVGRKFNGTRRAVLGVLLGVLTLVASICTGAAAAGATTSTPAGPAANTAGPALVTVKMVDHRLLQPKFFPPGRYTFRAVNVGKAPHALQIRGPGVTNARTPLVQPGQHADLTVTLGRGVYDFWCPIGQHRQMGMQLNVLVGGN